MSKIHLQGSACDQTDLHEQASACELSRRDRIVRIGELRFEILESAELAHLLRNAKHFHIGSAQFANEIPFKDCRPSYASALLRSVSSRLRRCTNKAQICRFRARPPSDYRSPVLFAT